MRLVPVTYRAKRIRGKLAWVNVYALANVGRVAGAVVVAGAAVSMLGSGVASATTPCAGGSGTITTAQSYLTWTSSPGDCTITTTGSVTRTDSITHGTYAGLAVQSYTVGTLSNSGTILGNLTPAAPSSGHVIGFEDTGTITAITNNAGALIGGQYTGTMTGSNNYFTITGLANLSEEGILGHIGTLTNNGIISAANIGTFSASQLSGNGANFIALENAGFIGTLTNNSTIAGTVGGSFTPISGDYYAAVGVGIQNDTGATIGSLTNAAGALIRGSTTGIDSHSNIGTLINNGTISGGLNGVYLGAGATINYFNNTGSVLGALSASTSGVAVGIHGTVGTLTNSGTISAQTALVVSSGGSIGTLTNQGTIAGGSEAGLSNNGVIQVLNNSGLVTTAAVSHTAALFNSGSMGVLTNSGTITASGSTATLLNFGTIGSLTNSGTISSTGSGPAILNVNGGSIGSLSNSGLITASSIGIYNAVSGVITDLDNGTLGTISATGSGGIAIDNDIQGTVSAGQGTIVTLTNEGLISGASIALRNAGLIGTLTNSGSLTGTVSGIENAAYGVINSFDNTITGVLTAVSGAAFKGDAGSTITAFSNEGLISGGSAGINNAGLISQLTNSGTITQTASGQNVAAIINSGTISTLANSGTISSTTWSAIINNAGAIGTVSNSGMIMAPASVIFNTGNGTIQELDNLAGGTIWSTDGTAATNEAGSSINVIQNAGSISGTTGGLSNHGVVGALTNSGSLFGGIFAIYNAATGTIGTITNEPGATIVGGSNAIFNNGGSIGTLTNHGVLQSEYIDIQNVGFFAAIDNSGVITNGGGNGQAIQNSGTILSLVNEGRAAILSGGTAVSTSGTIGTLSNAGLIHSSGTGSNNPAAVAVTGGGGIGSLTNSGTLTGWAGIENGVGTVTGGSIGTLLNVTTGLISSANTGDWAIYNSGSIGSLTNNGTISAVNTQAVGHAAIYNYSGVIGALANNGTITSNAYGISNEAGATITTLDNSATGSIIATASTITNGPNVVPVAAIYNDSTSSIGVLSNEGSISGVGTAISNAGSLGTLSNSGTVNGALGNGVNNTGSIASVANSGLISGQYGVYSSGSIGTINNSTGATISGTAIGLNNSGVIGGITNASIITGQGVGLDNSGTIGSIVSTGTISDSVSAGLLNSGTITSLVSQGLISGGFYGLANQNGGYIGSIDNSGTIVATEFAGLRTTGTIAALTNSGVITGAQEAVAIGSGGAINALTNIGTISAATALGVTGTGSLGTVTNSGTIAGTINYLATAGLNFAGGSGSTYGVFTGSSGGLGVADEGLINSTGSNVVFLGGNILLNDNINVGTNTVTNSAVLQVNNPLSITGNYHQTSAGNLVLGVTGTSNYGNLSVSGTATIDAEGNVSLTRLNGFSFAQGQTYTVVLAPTATYNVSTMNVAVSGYNGSTTVTQLQHGSEQDLVICLGSSAVCSTSSGSSGGSSGGGSTGGGTTGGGTTGGGTTGGGTTGGGTTGGGTTGGGTTGGGSTGGGTTGGGTTGGGSTGGGTTGGGTTGGGSTGSGSSGSTGSGGSSSTSTNHYSMATTSNAVAANSAIVGYTGSNEALTNLANQVVSLGSSAAANNAGNQLRADSHGPSSQLALQPALDVLNVVTAHSDETNLAMLDSPSGVAAGENAAGWAPWSEVLGTSGHQSNEGQFAGYGLSTEGILFGADKTITPEVRIGGLGSYTHASLTDHGDLTGDGTGLDNYGLFGYGTYVGSRAYFDISAGVMFDRFNTTRVVNVGNFSGTAYGKHDGVQEIAKVEGGYPFALNPQKTTTFSPLWGLAVLHLHQSAYDETGGSAAALAIGSSETWSVKSELGGKLEHSIKATGATWVPELRVLWRHEFDQSATSQRASFLEDNTGSTDFTTEGPRPEVNTGLLEAGVTVLTHGDVTLAVRYQADVGSGYFDQGGRLRLRWDF